ncbi:hypothetical protein D8674_011211 [Pyrus ussuriensis x Pyrus communis]|uniref:Uncharacterized protein n=1 Tax=Pyrus ussuriensis x Pyrus communis TaxID=2448454 RepID=A0A5N5FY67_9ROSA|nr:hypothetical protein D8674_011211 [Pyrus ussuriensis x Pyrus communis]
MSQLITRRRNVTNAPLALLASTVPTVSAPLIGETGASSSKSNTSEVDALKEEVTILKAIQMSGLQISLPTPDLATPSTSEPLCPTDTQ